MNKRKLLLVALSLCMVAILAMGGTLAYLTDTDQETNTFTVGNVKIDLIENFDEEHAHLIPATGSAQDGSLKNGITKEVFVKNTGSEKAYVRVHIAIPSILDNGDPTFDAGKNVLHFNAPKANYQDGLWNWSTTVDGNKDLGENQMVNGTWNFYTVNLPVKPAEGEKQISYNVYVVTFEASLDAGVQTCAAMNQVYLDKKVSSADMEKLQAALGTSWNIEVKAEGAQVAGFENAYDALNTSFGVPSSTNNPWAGYTTDGTTALPTT